MSLVLVAMGAACADKPTTTATATPEPAPVTDTAAPTEPVAAEAPEPAPPAGPDNSALLAALDAVDAAIAGCSGKLGTKHATECSDAVTAAVDGLADPIQSSSVATELAASQEQLNTHAGKLAEAAKAGKSKDKDQHAHLEDITELSRDMRGKL